MDPLVERADVGEAREDQRRDGGPRLDQGRPRLDHLGDGAGAVEDLKKFLARETDEKTFAAKRRIVALLVGKISEELLLKEAEAAGPGSNSAACFYAGVLRANAGDKKGAETLLDKAEKLAPMNSLVRLNAAAELRRLRDTR